jgi:hypothetical protein
LGEFDPARIDPAFFRQEPQERTIAAADIEDAAMRLNHIGDKQKIETAVAR